MKHLLKKNRCFLEGGLSWNQSICALVVGKEAQHKFPLFSINKPRREIMA